MDPVIILFAALTAFLSYRLFTVLGSKGGHEPDERDRPVLAPMPNDGSELGGAETEPKAGSRKPPPAWAQTVREDDPDFDADDFVLGAKAAYEMIVTAFASGDLSEVAEYIDPAIRKAFEIAIAARQTSGHETSVEFVGIEQAKVVGAERESAHLELTVDFRSDQIRVTRDQAGEIVSGDPNRIDAVKDRWTFSRPVTSRDPNWTLIATDAADDGAGGGPGDAG